MFSKIKDSVTLINKWPQKKPKQLQSKADPITNMCPLTVQFTQSQTDKYDSNILINMATKRLAHSSIIHLICHQLWPHQVNQSNDMNNHVLWIRYRIYIHSLLYIYQTVVNSKPLICMSPPEKYICSRQPWPLSSKCNQFIFVYSCTKVVNVVKFPEAVCKAPTHATETGSRNSRHTFDARFRCQFVCAVAWFLTSLTAFGSVNDIRSRVLARKTGTRIWRWIYAYGAD